MKASNPLHFLFLGISISLLFSCNPDNLELINPNELTPETYFKTHRQVQESVNAIYAELQTRGLFQRNYYFAHDNLSYEQLMNPSAEADKLQYSHYSFDATHKTIGEYWTNCYKGINRANFVIGNENRINQIVESELSEVMKKKYLGEAHFLRAIYYFMLVTRFGDIPIYTEIIEAGETGHPRSPKAAVWNLIEQDLEIAAVQCLSKTEEEKGRLTSGAAWALLGKAHLFQANESKNESDFIAAKNAFLKVISDEENYRLEDRYLNNFEEETEHGIESIFEIEFNPEAGSQDRWATEDGTGYNEFTFRGREYGFNDWYNVRPSQDLFNEFETVADNGIKTDPRRAYCIYSTGDLYYNNTLTVEISELHQYYNGEDFIIERSAWRKYQNYYKRAIEGDVSGINTKVIRLSDVKLMMAEVENELGNMDESVGYLNDIRNRADVMMPNYGNPAMDTVYPVSNQAQIRTAIEHERKVELCGEQVRFDDLVRWRRLEAFIDEILPTLPPYNRLNNCFDPAKHYLWPIPKAEIDLNDAISQSDQNFGY